MRFTMNFRIKISTFCLLFFMIIFAPVHAWAADGGQVGAPNASGGINETPKVDPIGSEEGYSAILYDSTNGLPTSESNAIAQTSEGFIWIGSYSGLIRYDGNDFERLDSTSGIASVKSLYVDSRDRLWIGTNESGVFMMEDGKLIGWDEKTGLKADSVRAIVEDRSGYIYIATTGGISMIDKSMQVTPFDSPVIEDAFMHDLRVGNDGLVYGLTNSGDVFTIRSGSLVNYFDHTLSGGEVVSCLLPDPERPGYVYMEASDSKLLYGNLAGGFDRLETIDISPLSQVQIFEYVNGRLWICARNGIGVLEADRSFNMLENVPMNNSIGHMLVDYEGNLWFTSSRQGVMKITPNRFLDIYEKNGLPEDVINSTCLKGDELFVGTDTGLTVIGPKGPVESIPLKSASTASGETLEDTDLIKMLEGCRIRSIIRDSKDRLWISTWRTIGLLCYDDGDVTVYGVDDGLYSDQIRAVYECKDGSFLVANTGGVCVIKNGQITDGYDEESGIENTEILTVAESFDGDLIVGTDGGGIYILGDGGTLHIGKAQRLTSEAVMRIVPDEARRIYWIVTGSSIAYMDEDYRVTTISRFPYSNNFAMYENKSGDMWILSSNGLYIASADDLLSGGEISTVYFGRSNGLPCIATANSYSELTENGDLYISGTNCVAKVNINAPLDMGNNLKASVPYIDVDGERIYPDQNGNFSIDPDVRKITIFPYVYNYSLLDPKVSYRLTGFDRSETIVLRSDMVPIDYTNLSGGNYRFEMQVIDQAGLYHEMLSVSIVKKKALYEQVWFYIVVGLVLAAAIVFGIREYIQYRIQLLEKKHHEEAEKERIANELETASRIQFSMLPHDFPPFPERTEFDIFATMDPAKEVGGDFYDFFLIDDDHLCILIADVSGKSIPAALFMMISKVILQSCAMLGKSAAEILEKTNDALCSKNQTTMFVTVWLGIMEISTGRITAANAGHEYPFIMKDGKFEMLKDVHGFVVGGMSGMTYTEYEIALNPGDKIFLYTDGVPEASDPDEQMFTTSRITEALNEDPAAAPDGILRNMKKSIDEFVKGAEQFDDITMLCMEYKGPGQN